ncbi:MAG: hypothetical protein KAZ88_00005 [Acidimicrobiia bacterium]|nr:hypothetical protein [Acidimicrobiia bacterium]MBP8179360.1 hypothetical protein [Acidimicrobiia bacterium]
MNRLIVSFVLLAAVLVGCSSDDDKGASSDASDAADSTVADESEKAGAAGTAAVAGETSESASIDYASIDSCQELADQFVGAIGVMINNFDAAAAGDGGGLTAQEMQAQGEAIDTEQLEAASTRLNCEGEIQSLVCDGLGKIEPKGDMGEALLSEFDGAC